MEKLTRVQSFDAKQILSSISANIFGNNGYNY